MDSIKCVYRILKALERNMGNEDFDVFCMSADERWEQLLILLQDDGLISGLDIYKRPADKYRHVATPAFPFITIKGIEYLETSPTMEKVRIIAERRLYTTRESR